MNKVAVREHGGQQYVWYFCVGCDHLHGVPSERWNWNGSMNSPTLSPSVRHFIPEGEWGPAKTICHYFVTEGKIHYCGDCEHSYSNQIVEMTEPTNVPENS